MATSFDRWVRWAGSALLVVGLGCGSDELTVTGGEPEPIDEPGGLTGDNMGGANLAGTNLGGANLGGTNLGGPNLGGTNLGGTNLGGTNLGGTNLGGTNLSTPNIGVNIHGPISRVGWTVTDNVADSEPTASLVDGSMSTRWSTKTGMVPGQYLIVDMGQTRTVAKIVMDSGTSTGDYARGYQIYFSTDGATWGSAVATGAGSGPVVTATFSAQSKRYVKIVQTGTSGSWWSISELTFYASSTAPTTAQGMLFSGEDLYTKSSSCAVLGIGSTALPRLIAANPGSKMYAALKKTNWGIATTSGGPVSLYSWEVLVWGSNTYCSFLVLAPSTATYPGIAGFVKAVFRWAAPPSKSIDIGQIGGGQTIATYSGMMDVGSKVLSGLVTEKAYVSGLFSFVSATTNNQTVNVDFASWVRKADNGGLILAAVQGNPQYADAVYMALERTDGTVSVHLRKFANMIAPGSGFSIERRAEAWSKGRATKPLAKRCSSARSLITYGDTATAAAKCDAYVKEDIDFYDSNGYESWENAGETGSQPYNQTMYLEPTAAKSSPTYKVKVSSTGEYLKVISETYVHLNEAGYDNKEFLNFSTGRTCRDIAGEQHGLRILCVSMAASASSSANGDLWLWESSTNAWTRASSIPGNRIAWGNQHVFMTNAANQVFKAPMPTGPGVWTPTWTQMPGACRDIAAVETKYNSDNPWCIGTGTPDGQLYQWNGTSWQAIGTMTGNRVGMDSDRGIVLVKSNGATYKYLSEWVFGDWAWPGAFDKVGTWVQIGSNCKDAGAGGGRIYCTDLNNNLQRYDRKTKTWTSVGATANVPWADSSGNLYFTDTSGYLRGWL